MLPWLYRHTVTRVPGLERVRVIRAMKQAYVRRRAANAAPPSKDTPVAAMEKIHPTIERVLDSAGCDAFGWLIRQLGLKVSPRRMLNEMLVRMTDADWAELTTLLGFVNCQSRREIRDSKTGKILRASELGDVATPVSRKNVLFVTGQFPNPMHGGGARVADFIKCLSRHHNIYLYTWFVEAEDAAASAMLAPFCKRIDLVRFLDFEHSLERLKKFVEGTPIDVVHYEWPRSLTNFDSTLGKQHIFTYMECVSLRLLMDLEFASPYSEAWLAKIVELLKSLKIELVDADRADRLVTVTRKDAEFLARFNPRRSHIVLNHGVMFDEFCLPDRIPEPRTLVFTGNFAHYPNADAARFFIEEILPLVASQVPDVKFYLVGTDPTNQVSRYLSHPRVVVTGQVEDVRPYIQNAAVCVAPLITGAGLRSKVIQYASLKRACVSTSIGVTDLSFEDERDVLIADDPAGFARGVVYLLQHPEFARSIADSAYEKTRLYYDNRILAACLENIYESFDHGVNAR